MRRLLLLFLLLFALLVHPSLCKAEAGQDTATAAAAKEVPVAPAEKNSGWLLSIVLSATALGGGVVLFGRYRKRR